MTNYPLPTPQVFAVHQSVVAMTWFRWQVVADTAQAMDHLQRIIGDAVLPALQQFADALASIDLDKLNDSQD